MINAEICDSNSAILNKYFFAGALKRSTGVITHKRLTAATSKIRSTTATSQKGSTHFVSQLVRSEWFLLRLLIYVFMG